MFPPTALSVLSVQPPLAPSRVFHCSDFHFLQDGPTERVFSHCCPASGGPRRPLSAPDENGSVAFSLLTLWMNQFSAQGGHCSPVEELLAAAGQGPVHSPGNPWNLTIHQRDLARGMSARRRSRVCDQTTDPPAPCSASMCPETMASAVLREHR